MENSQRYEILLVDDQEKNLQLLGNSLDAQGYSVIFATSGEEALEAVATGFPDLILLDVMMPDMDGYEVCRRLKGNEATAGIPVIFVTAKASSEDILKGFKAGGHDYITKPLKSAEMLARVKTHLDLQRTRKDLARSNRELEDLNQNQKQFFSILSHDLSGPIGVAENLLEELIESLKNDFDKDVFSSVLNDTHESISRVGKLMENILAWAKVQMNAVSFNPQLFLLDDCVDVVMDTFQPIADKKGVVLEKDLSGDVALFADLEMISTILRNLISNGLKFTPKAGSVTIAAKREESIVTLIVRDSGKGIAPDKIEDLFHRDKVHTTLGTEQEPGHGLGLSLCMGLAKKHGGRLKIESSPNEGTEVRVILPQNMDY